MGRLQNPQSMAINFPSTIQIYNKCINDVPLCFLTLIYDLPLFALAYPFLFVCVCDDHDICCCGSWWLKSHHLQEHFPVFSQCVLLWIVSFHEPWRKRKLPSKGKRPAYLRTCCGHCSIVREMRCFRVQTSIKHFWADIDSGSWLWSTGTPARWCPLFPVLHGDDGGLCARP